MNYRIVKNLFFVFIPMFIVLFFQNCGKAPEAENSTTIPVSTCSATQLSQLETNMTSALSTATSEVDFSFLVERADGRQFSYSRGSSTITTSYESASTSKLISAIIILRLVDQGYLTLNSKPQDFITSWPILSTDPLYNMTLRNLLSFTSGLNDDPPSPFGCINLPNASFESCVNTIATTNQNNGITPGTQYYYASSHLQVAGLMAVKAKGVATWQDVFTAFKNETGLFSTATYDLPSIANPRLAGGMHWTATEYLDFLRALKNGTLLSSTLQNEFLADQIPTATVTIAYSPITASSVGEVWHYGFGSWHECQDLVSYSCTPGTRISSPGAYGGYPFWDRTKNYIGIVARQGTIGTFPNGLIIERAVRSDVEAWVACQ